MSYFMVDIEADGPIPGDYSMVSFGAVVVKPDLDTKFYGLCRPISEKWVPEALAVSGHTREETLTFPDPLETMTAFGKWIDENSRGRAILVSDNNGFDFMFVCWYFWHFLGSSPFGHTSRNLGDVYKGLTQDMMANFKHLRDTKHDHNPVNDATSNAEAMLKMRDQMGLKAPFR